MCAVCSLASFIPLGLRGFFAVVARGGVWRLPVFFVAAGASDVWRGLIYVFGSFLFLWHRVLSG